MSAKTWKEKVIAAMGHDLTISEVEIVDARFTIKLAGDMRVSGNSEGRKAFLEWGRSGKRFQHCAALVLG